MKNKIFKYILSLLLIIEFYPVESNSQDLPEVRKFSLNYGSSMLSGINFELYDPEVTDEKNVSEIKFSLFSEGKVILNIFDPEGNLVEELVNGDLSEGEYAVYFKVNQLIKPGYYKCVLMHNGYSLCKQIFPLK